MSLDTLEPKIQQMIDSQIKFIRRMATLSDEQIQTLLLQQLLEHPHLIENYEKEEQNKLLHDITKAAKDIKSNPIKLARRVDGGITL